MARILYYLQPRMVMRSDLRPTDSQTALVIGGTPDTLEAIEPMLDGARWSVEFVEMSDEPYATVVAMRPDLVVVHLGLDEPAGFGLLSMLRLDPRTRGIPVLSYVGDGDNAVSADVFIENASLLPLDALMTTRAPRH